MVSVSALPPLTTAILGPMEAGPVSMRDFCGVVIGAVLAVEEVIRFPASTTK